MSNSSLVNVKVPAYNANYSQGRSGRKIEMIALHHMAGILTAEQCGRIFQQVGRQASANYGVGCDCKVALYVDEENTSWANANWDSNCKAVTVEISNCEIGGDYKVADDVLNKVIELVADIAQRNNLGKLVKGKNLTWHSMYCATACPGKYILSKIDYIIEEANKLIDGEKPVTPINRKYKVGQKVRVSSYYASSTDPVSKAILKNATGTITRVLDNECHNPYLLENGNIGWCNDGDIREVISDSYIVKVTVPALNIRAGAGTNYSITGCIRDNGKYTIVETKNNWGKLKSGLGWICLDYTKRV